MPPVGFIIRSALVLAVACLASIGPRSVAGATPAAACQPHLSTFATGFGSPDDVAVRGKQVLFGDLIAGALVGVESGQPRILRRGLDVPEGIVPETRGVIVVVEQGLNRLDRLLPNGTLQVMVQLRNATGQEGVDGIRAAPHGGIYIPDSPYGTLWLLDKAGKLHLVAQGMARPVDVIPFRNGLAVADENAHAVWEVRNDHLSRLATLSTPDDLVVWHGHLLATTLGDGGLWEAWPRQVRLPLQFGEPQGLAVLANGDLVLADSRANRLYRISRFNGCL